MEISNSGAGFEILEDIKITVMHGLYKKGVEFTEAEKIAECVKEKVLINFPSQNNYIPNLRGLAGKGKRQWVIDLHNKGQKAREIIKQTGLSSATVYGYIRDRHKPVNEPGKNSNTRNSTLDVIKLHAAKALLQNKVDSVTCQKIIEDICIMLQKNWSGIIFSLPKSESSGNLKTKQEKARTVFEGYKQGLAPSKLAIKHNLSREAVKSIIRRMKNIKSEE